MTRQTLIELDCELALHTGIQSALADKHRLTKMRISSTLHNVIVHSGGFSRPEVEASQTLRHFRNYYDPSYRNGILHSELCGTFLGTEVFLDGHLEGHTMVAESDVIPE
jgi:hypothetical protein